MTDTCTAPCHDSDENPPLVEGHAMLCRPCRYRMRRDLRRIPNLDAALSHAGILRKGTAGSGDGLPISEPAADCQSQIRHDITWWTSHAANDRRLDAIPLGRAGLGAMCVWLWEQVDWIRFREWAPDMAGTIAADAGRANALLDPWITKRFAITGPDGVCPDCHTGRIMLTLYATEGDRRRSFAECDQCGREWLPETWLRLGERIIRRRETTAS